MVTDIASSTEDYGLNSQASQMGLKCRQRLAIDATLLRCQGNYAAEMDPATRYTLRRDSGSLIKIWFFDVTEFIFVARTKGKKQIINIWSLTCLMQ